MVAPLPAQEAFRWASACRLFFTAGHAVLAEQRAQVEIERCTLAEGSGSSTQLDWAEQAGLQLAAVLEVITSLRATTAPSQVAADFAGSTARPSNLLPWLLEVTEALLLANPGAEEDAEGRLAPSVGRLVNFTMLIYHVLGSTAYAKHAAALSTNGPLLQAVARLLLRRCLPSTVHWYRQGQLFIHDRAAHLQDIATLLANDQLRPAL